MRPLEVALIVAVVLAAAGPWLLRHSSRALAPALTLVALALAVAQVVLEAPRWQLVPIWLAVGLLLVTAARDLLPVSAPTPAGAGSDEGLLSPDDPQALDVTPSGWRVALPTLVLVAVGGALAWALPVVELPTPAGEFAVGTATGVLVDVDRTERYGPDPGGPRVLPLQVWYPTTAAAPEDDAAPWLLDRAGVVEAAARDVGLPSFALAHLTLVQSHAYLDAPLAEAGELPLVLYAHGWSGFREIHSTVLEELASRGYVVVAADHTYGALATQLPGGEIAELDPAALPSNVPSEQYDEASRWLVETFADDLEVILDRLLAGELFAEVLDPERLSTGSVALIGHSTGGGAAILVCSRDPRCQAVVGYDPWVEPIPDEVIGGDLAVPLLSLRSGEWVDNDNDVRLRRLHAGSSAPEGRVALPGINHRDLTVLPLLSPLSSWLGGSGPDADRDALAALDRWTVRFLDHTLHGTGVDPLAVPPETERTILETGNGNG